MRVITAPDLYKREDGDIVCFLAGGISNCENWQQAVQTYLKNIEATGFNLDNLVLINPRRKVFEHLEDPAESVKQIEWEFRYLTMADIISVYFAASTTSPQPITLYELGRNMTRWLENYGEEARKHVIVSVEDGYLRELDVLTQVKLASGGSIVPVRHATPLIHAINIASATEFLTGNLPIYKP